MEGRNLVSWPAILGTLALVVLGLLAWELRWVLLVLFGAVVLAVALDVPVQVLMRRTPLHRPQALVVVVGLLVLLGWELGFLLLPELVQQVATLNELLPQLLQRVGAFLSEIRGVGPLGSSLESSGGLSALQPLGSQLLGLAGGAANSSIQVLLMALLALLMALLSSGMLLSTLLAFLETKPIPLLLHESCRSFSALTAVLYAEQPR